MGVIVERRLQPQRRGRSNPDPNPTDLGARGQPRARQRAINEAVAPGVTYYCDKPRQPARSAGHTSSGAVPRGAMAPPLVLLRPAAAYTAADIAAAPYTMRRMAGPVLKGRRLALFRWAAESRLLGGLLRRRATRACA